MQPCAEKDENENRYDYPNCLHEVRSTLSERFPQVWEKHGRHLLQEYQTMAISYLYNDYA